LPEGLIIGGVLPRGDVRDALISSKSIKLEDLTKRNDLVIATSSLRRTAHLLRLNPDLNIKDIRGNVNTRVKKMEDGYCDVMLMAAAGLQRLEMDEYISDTLDPEVVIPAVSQGAIAIQTRENDNFVSSVINQINHEQTFLATRAERIFLRMLEGGCQIPIGCYSKINGDNFSIKGFLSYIDGTEIIEETLTGKLEDADQLAEKLANIFIKAGAPEILARIRKANKS